MTSISLNNANDARARIASAADGDRPSSVATVTLHNPCFLRARHSFARVAHWSYRRSRRATRIRPRSPNAACKCYESRIRQEFESSLLGCDPRHNSLPLSSRVRSPLPTTSLRSKFREFLSHHECVVLRPVSPRRGIGTAEPLRRVCPNPFLDGAGMSRR